MDIEYTDTFQVIIDKRPRFPRFFVHHELHSKISVSTLKYDNYNIVLTLQSISIWLTFNNFFTHREASIGFLKYVSTGLILQHTAKKRIISALMNVDLTGNGIIALQKNIDNKINTNNSNKHSPDDQIKHATDRHKRNAFPAFDLSMKRIEF